MVDLNENLLPEDSPIAENQGAVSAYDFDGGNERNVISLTKIKNFSFNAGTGGTLVLGGTNNLSGMLKIRNEAGTTIIQGDSDGMHFYDEGGTEQIKIDEGGLYGLSGTGGTLIKVDDVGLHAYNSGGTELVKVAVTGFHGLAPAGGTLITVDGTGLHAYGTSGTELIKVDVNGFHAFDASGSETFQIGTAGLIGFGQVDNVIALRASVGGSQYAKIGYGTTGALYQGIPDTFIGGGGGKVQSLATEINLVSASNSGSAILLRSANGGGIRISADGDINNLCANFNINGSAKTAIVPTSDGYKALYTNESPEVWFMDFCESKEKIDLTFLEVTSPPYHFIKCEGGEYQVWGKRKGMEHLRFESKTQEQFDKNNAFWSIPHQ